MRPELLTVEYAHDALSPDLKIVIVELSPGWKAVIVVVPKVVIFVHSSMETGLEDAVYPSKT